MARVSASASARQPVRFCLLHGLFFLSGATALGYQMVWTRVVGAGLGHEVPALLGVVTAFLGGMALGSWGCQVWLQRSVNPLRWYACLEWLIGLWGAVAAWLIPWATSWVQQLPGPEPAGVVPWATAFVLPLVSLLPATAAMGATLPAMERALVTARGHGRWVGGLYAANTAGACVGTLGTPYLLLPSLGLRSTALALTAACAFCGIAAWWLARGAHPIPAKEASETSSSAVINRKAEFLSTPRWCVTAFWSGLLGLGFQVVTVRLLSQVLENTLYTYADVLATYLIATAAGAALYQRWGRTVTLSALLYCLASACVVSAWAALWLPSCYRGLRAGLGDSLPGVLGAEMAAAWLVLGLPSGLMGATFSHLTQRAAQDRCVGTACALNTLGAAAAVGFFGVWLLPHLGLKGALLVLTAGYLVCLPALGNWRWSLALMLPIGGIVCLPPLRLAELSDGAETIAFREGAMATVMVVRTPDGQRSLRVNGRLQMGGTAAAVAERRQAHLPLLLHSHPARALFLGPGTGITVGAAASHPGVRVDAVELVPEVVEMLGQFEPENAGARTNSAVHWVVSDARRFVRTSNQPYDVIVADLFHPAQDGAGFLYTREHFEAIRRRLAAGGLFCQWLPLHQLNEEAARSIVRTFVDVFPQAEAVLLHFNVDVPVVGLLGRESGGGITWQELERRMNQTELQSTLRGVGLDRPIQVFGCLQSDADGLRRFAGDAPRCTDDAPFVLFAAPRQGAQRAARPFDVLLSWLQKVGAPSASWLRAHISDGASDETIRRNVNEFMEARDIYLRGLTEEASGDLSAAIERYLESARRSLFFTPAYARMVTIVQVLASSDRTRARALFQRLEAARPEQPLGRRLLGPLFQ